MKAFVKKGTLPDAPAPTKPVKAIDPWEKAYFEGLQHGPALGEFQPKTQVTEWTDKRCETISEMWKAGLMVKEIAPHVGGNIKATQNKISYMISRGQLPKRRKKFTQEEEAEMREELETMTVPEICEKHLICQSKLKRILNG